MGSLFDWITDWIKEGLIEAITGQYTGIFESVNNQVADVAGQVGQTPQGWNGGVFSMIQNLSETVVIPIAGIILTFVLVYELIQMILEKNNMHDFDTFNIFKWIFKTFVATYLLTNCFTIVMAVFDVAQSVVSQSAGVINGNLDVTAALADLETQLEAMGMWELIGLWLETNIINLCMWVLSIVIFVIVYTYVPMLVSASKISDEITQAAITRGIDHVQRRTCMETVRFHVMDMLILVVYITVIILAFLANGKGWF